MTELRAGEKICQQCSRYSLGIMGGYCYTKHDGYGFWNSTPIDGDFYVPDNCNFILEQTLENDRLVHGDNAAKP